MLDGLSYNANVNNEALSDNVIMETLICKIKLFDESGKAFEKEVRVFVDSGSNMNILRRSVAEGAAGKDSYFAPFVTGAERLQPTKEKDVVFSLVSLDGRFESPKFFATTTKDPTAPFPPVTVDPKVYPYLKGVEFTEDYPRHSFVDIDLLVGLQVWYSIDDGKVKRGNPREPVARKSKLGWILSGVSEHQAYHSVPIHQPMVNLAFNDPHQPIAVKEPKTPGSITQIKSGLEKLWKLETIGISDPVDSELTVEQERARKCFYDKIEFKDGKYFVPMLWKDDEPELESNFRRALRRDEALCNRFAKPGNEEQRKLFIEAVEKFFEEGYAVKLTDEDLTAPTDGPVRYLSLQAVFRADKPMPRPVFDASEKTQDGKSLNSEVLQGPPNLNDLVEILLRFRTRPIVVTADIKAMFLRINLLDGTDSHRFLWRRLNKNVAPTICRLLTVTFGVIDSPYKAIEVVLYHASEHKDQFPLAHKAVTDDSYVDDILSGAYTVQEALELYHELKTMLALGGFHLAKTMSNSEEFMKSIPEEERAPLKVRSIQGSEDAVGTHSALGAAWDPQHDTLIYTFFDKFEDPKKGMFTRRVILSQGSKVFDPSGLIAPAMLEVKLILRDCTEVAGGEWDVPMPEPIVRRFLAWREALVKQASVTVPRCVTPVGCHDIQLHVMTDASAVAYAACVYVRVKFKDKIKCSLLIAKTRLAPTELLASRRIPRLELLGCLLGIRLFKYASKALERSVKFKKVMFWSDSKIALAWIAKSPEKLKTFLSNRVKEIRAHSEPSQWVHLPGELNVSADLASRGCTAQELAENEEWLGGPKVLNQEEDEWEKIPDFKKREKLSSEEMALIKEEEAEHKEVFASKRMNVADIWLRQIFLKYESLAKAIRVVALIRRACARFRKKKRLVAAAKQKLSKLAVEAGVVSSGEVQVSMVEFLKLVQRGSLQAEISAVKEKLSTKNSQLRALNPFISQQGLLVMGGRVSHPTNEAAANPVILPDKDELVSRLIMEIHCRAQHVGPEHTLFLIRQKYWPLGGRRSVKTVLAKCLKCRIFKAEPMKQIQAPLPEERTKNAAPFTYVGLDFAGPIPVYLADGTSEKSYIALFVCLSTRALHIELTMGMSTEHFTDAIRKMIARRGWPQKIFSDNARTFVRVDKDLQKRLGRIDWKKVQDISPPHVGDALEWCFNAPKASWWGGHFERFVGLIKVRLRKNLGTAKLNQSQMQVTLCEIEAVINSRPIAVVRSDKGDPLPITPGHMACNRNMAVVPQGKQDDFANEDVCQRARHQQHLVKQLWTAFQREYIAELQVRRKWRDASDLSKLEGKVVLIRDESLTKKACRWPMGLIIQPVAGRDGQVRSCDVRLANGKIIKRPIQLLALIEEQEQEKHQ